MWSLPSTLHVCTVFMEEVCIYVFIFSITESSSAKPEGTGREAKTHQAQKKRARGLIKSFVQNNSCRTRVHKGTSSTLVLCLFFFHALHRFRRREQCDASLSSILSVLQSRRLVRQWCKNYICAINNAGLSAPRNFLWAKVLFGFPKYSMICVCFFFNSIENVKEVNEGDRKQCFFTAMTVIC